MRRPQGYATIVDPDRPVVERDTLTCGHCQRIVFVKPGSVGVTYLLPGRLPTDPWREVAGAGCRVCMTSICLACEAQGRCTPWERRLEQMEARDRLCRAVGVG